MIRGRSIFAGAALAVMPMLAAAALPAYADDGIQVMSTAAAAGTRPPTSDIVTGGGGAVTFTPSKLTVSNLTKRCGGGQGYGFNVDNQTTTTQRLTYHGSPIASKIDAGKKLLVCVSGKVGQSGTFSLVSNASARLKITVG